MRRRRIVARTTRQHHSGWNANIIADAISDGGALVRYGIGSSC